MVHNKMVSRIPK